MGKKDKGIWSSKVGRDCVSLDTSLCRWLGKRLTHLANHSTGVPVAFINENPRLGEDVQDAVWRSVMSVHAANLVAYGKRHDAEEDDLEGIVERSKDALHWVAKWLPHLWD